MSYFEMRVIDRPFYSNQIPNTVDLRPQRHQRMIRRMNVSAAILAILLMGSALGRVPKQAVNGYPMLDANHIYRPGEQVRVDKQHGVHSGLLMMDSVYFVRPVNVTITRRKKVSNSFFNWNGSLVADVRHATSAAWERRTFAGGCENVDLTVGQIENGGFDDKEEQLRIGSRNSTCEFRPIDNAKSEPAVRQARGVVGSSQAANTVIAIIYLTSSEL